MPLSNLRDASHLVDFGLQWLGRQFDGSSHYNMTDSDREFVSQVQDSISAYRALNDEMVADGFSPFMVQNGRMYFSDDKSQLETYMQYWQAAGIEVQWATPEQLREQSVLTEQAKFGLYMPKDGQLLPDADARISSYLEWKCPGFRADQMAVASGTYDPDSQRIRSLEFQGSSGSVTVSPDLTCFSLGNNSLRMVTTEGDILPLVPEDFPIAGWSLNIRITVTERELQDRLPKGVDLLDYVHSGQLLPIATTSNFHLTPMPESVTRNDDGTVSLSARVTLGGNMGREDGHPDDLVYAKAQIKKFVVGNVDILSENTCVRRSSRVNEPVTSRVFQNAMVGWGQSGVGVSWAAVPHQNLDPVSQFHWSRASASNR
ncbi:MAG: FAD-dependent oxidoreductase [bacterium]|nr:FAD-dependent oxidoreductase [bacterium]